MDDAAHEEMTVEDDDDSVHYEDVVEIDVPGVGRIE